MDIFDDQMITNLIEFVVIASGCVGLDKPFSQFGVENMESQAKRRIAIRSIARQIGAEYIGAIGPALGRGAPRAAVIFTGPAIPETAVG